MKSKTFYVCDPNKATNCKKTYCAHNEKSVYPICTRTSRVEWAVRDKQGKPIISKE